jgi:hypothetical protein
VQSNITPFLHALGRKFVSSPLGVVWLKQPVLSGLALFFGLVLPLGLLFAISVLHISKLSLFFSPQLLILLPILSFAVVIFFIYLAYVTALKPFAFFIYFSIFRQLALFGDTQLKNLISINLHFRLIETPLLVLPLIYTAYKYGFKKYSVQLMQGLFFIKYHLLFFVYFLYYYLFNNLHTTLASKGNVDSISNGDLSTNALSSHFLALLGILFTFNVFLNEPDKDALFDRVNKIIFLISSLFSGLAILAFPLGLMRMNLDGFVRSVGFFDHPASYSSYLGFLCLYQIGVIFYYLNPQHEKRLPINFLFITLLINLFAMLIGLAKTTIVAVLIGSIFMLIMNIKLPVVRKNILKVSILSFTFGLLALIGFQAATSTNIVDTLQARFENNATLEHREKRWDLLKADMDWSNISFGHGLTAGNNLVYYHWFNENDGAPGIKVHNGYLELLYDMGIIGYLFLMPHFLMVWEACKRFFMKVYAPFYSLNVMLIAIVSFYLIQLYFGEMMTQSIGNALFWVLSCVVCLYQAYYVKQLGTLKS